MHEAGRTPGRLGVNFAVEIAGLWGQAKYIHAGTIQHVKHGKCYRISSRSTTPSHDSLTATDKIFLRCANRANTERPLFAGNIDGMAILPPGRHHGTGSWNLQFMYRLITGIRVIKMGQLAPPPRIFQTIYSIFILTGCIYVYMV